MSPSPRLSESFTRHASMLRSAFAGPVQAALDASDTIEILANADGSVWIERADLGLARAPEQLGLAERERIIRLVASFANAPCDLSAPIVSAELPQTRERFEGILPPVSEAPCFAIRKATQSAVSLDSYEGSGAISPALGIALRKALEDRLNIVIAGGTSSGKTTFANALLAERQLREDRIVILEDTRELRCIAHNVAQLRTHRTSVTLRDLVRSTMRLRPDRIIVGEVRGGEALDLLKAWNTGHPGGITTLHANSAHGALIRLEQLVAETTSGLPYALIGEAVDVVVFMSRHTGERRVEEALRILRFDEDGYRTEPLVTPGLAIVQ